MRKIRWFAVILAVVIIAVALIGCTGNELPSDTEITVTFETNGGTAIEPIVVTADTEFKMPKDPKRTGYTFAGWYLDAEFSQKLDKSYYNAHKGETPPEIAESMTVYAKWFEGTHEHTLEILDTQAETCTQDGFTLSVCSDEECNYIKFRTIESLGHDLEHFDAKAPTCTEVGWEEYDACTRCDYTTYEEIDALGHDIISETIVEPNCTDDGEREERCSRCDHFESITIPALGHTPSEWITDEEATCMEAGSKHKECTICHIALDTEVITALGHNYVNGVCSECGRIKATEGLTYSCDSDTQSYAITGYTGTDTDVYIPSVYDDGTNGEHAVTSIGEKAFYKCETLTRVTIPDSVTQIGRSAFEYCTCLPSVNIPDSVTSIGYHAFYDCSGLTSVHITNLSAWCGIEFDGNPLEQAHNLYLNGTLVTDLVIPNDVTEIKAYAFEGATCLTSVTIHSSVTSIGTYAFFGCTSLTSVYISDLSAWCGIAFGAWASNPLCYTKNLYLNGALVTDLVIPNDVTKIKAYAFYDATFLTSVTIPDSVTSIGRDAFRDCERLTSVTIPSSVTSIGSSAFLHCSGLTSVYISDLSAWCEIEFGWFYSNPLYYAHNLYLNGTLVTDLVIPNDITVIKANAFEGATCLTSVTIPDSVTSIGAYAFSGCTGLMSITIPESVTSIGSPAFSDCTSLTSITVEEGNTKYHSSGNCLIETASKTLIAGCNTSVIPDDGSVTNIGGYAFYNCIGLTSVNIPDGVTSIGGYAFYDCTGLMSITIPDSVTSIGGDAFSGCTGLTSVNIPDGVTGIGHDTFYNCTGLTSITIPASVTSIETNAFFCCYKLVEVYNKSNLTITAGSWENGYVAYYAKNVYTDTEGQSKLSTDENGYIIYTDGEDKLLMGYTGTETELALPETITEIYQFAFWKNKNITSVNIPSSVISIGSRAFYGCTELKSIYYGGTKADWRSIEKDIGWDYSAGNYKIYYNNGVPCEERTPGGWIIDKEPTCTEAGAKHTECTVCGEVLETEEIVALGHKSGDWIVDVEATCTETGTKHKECAVCGAVLETETIIALGHRGGTATCTEQAICSECGKVYREPLEHDIIHHDTQSPTCTEAGWEAYDTCSRCDYTTYVEIVALGHDLVHHDAKSPTCTEAGWKAYDTCSRCEHTTYKAVDALGHDLSIETLTASTCTVAGTGKATCSRCDYENTVTLPKASHNYVNGKCSVCGETKVTEGLTYSYDSDTQSYTVTDYTGTDTDVYIPSVYNDGTNGEHAVTSIGKEAFARTSITGVTIPDSVYAIGSDAFIGCTGLTEINYNATNCEDLYGGNNCVFYNAGTEGAGIKVTIGANVKNIPAYLFYPYYDSSHSPKITEVVFEEGSVCENIGTSAFRDCSSLTSITIPDNVTSIGSSVFSGCTSLTSITIPDSVTNIGDSAFNHTVWYDEQPDGVVYAGKVAYKYKGNMPKETAVVLKEGTLGIADGAFVECGGLNSITIPSSVMYIGEVPFFCCVNLESITVKDGNAKYHSAGNCLIETASKTLIQGCNASVIPDDGSVTSIGYGSFAGIGIESINIPDCVTSIEEYAFKWCPRLKSVVIGDGVTDIAGGTFEEDLNLTSVVLGKSVTNIGNYAFALCYELIEIYNKSALTLTIGSEDNGRVAEYAKNVYTDTEGQTKLSTDEDGYIIYTDGEEKLLMGYIGTETELTLPDGITEIYEYAFYDGFVGYLYKGITSIVIPNSVKIIGQSAFEGCASLENITIGNGVEIVGDYAFKSTAWYDDQPDGLIYIGKVAYKYKGTMPEETEIELKDGTTSIAYGAFEDCTGLTSITIPSSVYLIGKDAFRNCTNLVSVYITDLSAWLGIDFRSNPLRGSTSLYINGERPSGDIVIEDGVTSIPAYTFYNCADVTSVTIPDSVTSIGDYAFYGTGITSITVPENVTAIGTRAFGKCASLTTVNWNRKEHKMKNMLDDMLDNAYIFAESTNITTINIGKNVEVLYEYWAMLFFENNITNITVSDGNTKYHSSGNCLIETSSKTLMLGGKTSEIPNDGSVTSIACAAFAGSIGLTSVVIPEGVTTIASAAFAGCTDMESVVLPSSLKKIYGLGNNSDNDGGLAETVGAFYGCTGLKSISGSANIVYQVINQAEAYDVTTIAITSGTSVTSNSRFREMVPSLTSVTIGDTVTSIGSNAFNGCIDLTNVTISDSVESIGSNAFYNTAWYKSQPDGLVYVGKVAYKYKGTMSENTTIEIKDGTKGIAGSAFADFTSLVSVTIPDGVTNIGYRAFYGCTGLTSVDIPDSVKDIGEEAFYGCTGLTSVIIPDGVTNIGYSAFNGCTSLTSITIPDSVYAIGRNAFYNTVWYDEQPDGLVYAGKVAYKYKGAMPENTTIELEEGTKSIAGYAFSSCNNLANITIPDSVMSIGEKAFTYCTGLTSIIIPASVTSIDDCAFDYCYKLIEVYNKSSLTIRAGSDENGYDVAYYAKNVYTDTEGQSKLSTDENGYQIYTDGENKILMRYVGTETELILPDSITEIYQYAFYKNKNITSVTIPEKVTSIGESAFEYCTGLTTVSWNATACTFSSADGFGSIFGWVPNLTTVNIGNKVTKIPSYAFYYCESLTSVHITDLSAWCGIEFGNAYSNPLLYAHKLYLNDALVTDLVIPNDITEIKAYAFEGATCLTSVTIPDSVTSIGDVAFYYCTGLTSITIPDSVTSIGDSAFYNCRGLTSVTIPNSVRLIWYDAFDGCTGVTELKYNGTKEQWGNIEGASSINLPNVYTVTCSDGKVCLRHQPGEWIIDAEATCIEGGSKHKECTACGITVTRTTISALGHDLTLTITNQATCAMEGSGKKTCSRCDYEEAVTLPKIPHDIVSGTCSVCGQAEPEGSEWLRYEFDSDSQSYSVIGYWGTDDIIIIPSTFDDGVNGVHPVSTIKSLINDAEEIFLALTYSTVIIPDSVTKIGPCIWGYNSYLTKIYISSANPVYHVTDNCLIETATKTLIAGCKSSIIPDDGSVTSIGPYAFAYCLGLAEIVIPDCVESIGENAFKDCIDLVKITIGSEVESIGANAFDNCDKLVEIYNKSALDIDEIEFNSGNQPNVYTDASKSKISYIDDYVIYTDGGRTVLMGYLGDEYDIVLPSGIDEIYPFAFAYNRRLIRVVISDSVNEIGDGAFVGCFSLVHLTIGSGVKAVGEEFVYYDMRLAEIYNKSGLSDTELWERDPSIQAFNVNIYTNANGGKVKISDDGFVYYGTTIAGYIGTETEITINRSLRDYALIGSKFKSVTIGNVPQFAFMACLGLTSVTISGDIEYGAFAYCANLTTVTISKSVTKIGAGAFDGCTSLTSITYEGTMEEWSAVSLGTDGQTELGIKTVVCSDGTITLSEDTTSEEN